LTLALDTFRENQGSANWVKIFAAAVGCDWLKELEWGRAALVFCSACCDWPSVQDAFSCARNSAAPQILAVLADISAKSAALTQAAVPK